MMTRMELALAAVLAVTAAAGGTAALASGKPGMQHADRGAFAQERFAEMDADKDGKVTAAEMRAFHDARFAKADANGDGKLSLEELDESRRAERQDRLKKMVLWLDADGDGMLSSEEFEPRKGAMLSRMDADGDGALSMEEMRDGAGRFHHRSGGHHGGRHGGPADAPTDGAVPKN